MTEVAPWCRQCNRWPCLWPEYDRRHWTTGTTPMHLLELDEHVDYDAYVPCSGCGLRNYDTRNPVWNCPDYPMCAEAVIKAEFGNVSDTRPAH